MMITIDEYVYIAIHSSKRWTTSVINNETSAILYMENKNIYLDIKADIEITSRNLKRSGKFLWHDYSIKIYI